MPQSPAIKNAPLPAEGPGTDHFSNLLLFSILFFVPYYLKRKVGGGFKTFIFFALVTSLPLLMAFWSIASTFSPRKNEKVKLPGKPIEHYLDFKTPQLREKYSGRSKIPMETFHEMYFRGEVDIKADMLDILELRHDWASFRFTMSLYWYFLTGMMPEVILHSRSQGNTAPNQPYNLARRHPPVGATLFSS